jgi:hypothetical protein
MIRFPMKKIYRRTGRHVKEKNRIGVKATRYADSRGKGCVTSSFDPGLEVNGNWGWEYRSGALKLIGQQAEWQICSKMKMGI